MPRKPVLAYAIGGTAAAVAAIVITASTVGLTPSRSEGAPSDPASASVVVPAGTNGVLTSYEGDDEHAYTQSTERHGEHEEHEHDDDD